MNHPVPTSKTDSLKNSMALLGWEGLLEALAGRAVSDQVRERCRNWEPADNLETANHWLQETGEMLRLLDGVEDLPFQAFFNLEIIIKDICEHLLLEPEHGLSILKTLRVTRDLKRFLTKQTEAPLLQKTAQQLEPFAELIQELERCLSDEGEVKPNASPELKQAYRELERSRQSLDSAVQKLMSSSACKDALQDAYFTEREGRVVLPIKTDARSKVEGIVHDSSGSGQTLFVEPTPIIALNNQLKISRLNVDKEILRVLENLAKQVREREDGLLQNQVHLENLELIWARARLAKLMDATCPTLEENGPVTLKQARNPELVLSRQPVVANDIVWSPETQVIIISGPNTGGKTVTLKTVGLMALMARSGLFIPAQKESAIRFFPEIYADIGDDQSIQQNLSTFSGHLKKIIHILDQACSGALILLDELGIATDPQEGAALAESVLVEMKHRGFTTLVSTHYLSIKTLAQTQEGFLNACTEFDLEALAPTYNLVFGVPGDSAALETAERLGLPESTLERARNLYQQKDNRAENLLRDLNRQKLDLEKEKEAIQEQREETDRLLREQKQLTEALRFQEKDFAKTKSKRIQSYVNEAKREIKQLVQQAKSKNDLPGLRKAEKEIHRMGRTPLAAQGPDRTGWDVPPEKLKEGDDILVEDYNACGILLEDAQGKDRVRVQLGNLTTVVETKRLKGHTQHTGKRKKNTKGNEVKIQTESGSHPRSSLDLRGMRVQEAQEALELFLSQAVVNKLGTVTIVHGHGMGTIKQMVRDYLGSAGIGKSFKPGERHEGGDGVTVVTF